MKRSMFLTAIVLSSFNIYGMCFHEVPNALFQAVVAANVEEVRRLSQDNRLINSLDTNRNTPLHEAARLDHREMVTILIEAGASTDYHNKDGKKPCDLTNDSQLKEDLEDARREANINAIFTFTIPFMLICLLSHLNRI